MFISYKSFKGRFLGQFLCPNLEDYSPCNCFQHHGFTDVSIQCQLTSLNRIYDTFQWTIPADVDYLGLDPKSNNFSYIPENLFGEKHRFREIFVRVTERYLTHPEIMIHPKAFAFSSTRSFTTSFTISNHNISPLSFEFLKDFHQLKRLSISNSINVHLSNLPALPNLDVITISSSTLLGSLLTNCSMQKRLQDLSLSQNGINDKLAEQILQWIAAGSSRHTLSSINLSRNKLTKIPSLLKSFSNLKTIYLKQQEFPGFSHISLSLPFYSFKEIDLRSSYITHIEPGTFKSRLALKLN